MRWLTVTILDMLKIILKTLLVGLLIQLSVASTALAKSHDYIQERAYLEDKTNALSFEEIQTKSFQPFDGLFSQGYSKSAFWLRLKIEANTQPDLKELVLRIQPTYLDEIQFYDPAHPSAKQRVTGDRSSLNDSEYQSLAYNFVMPADATPRYVWLRLKTTSTNLMQVRVLDMKGAQASDRVYEAFASVVFSVLVIFMVWAAVHWLMFRERVVGIFVIRQLSTILFVAAYVGYFRVLFSDQFSPAMLDLSLSLLVLLGSATAIWFHIEFFKDYQLNRWLRLGLLIPVVSFPLELVMMWMGHLSKALEMNMAIILLAPIYMLLITIFGIRWDKLKDAIFVLPRASLILFHAAYLLIVVIVALPSLGLFATTEFAPHTVLLHGVVTGLAMMMMLLYRSKHIQQKSLIDVAVAHQEAVNEKFQREEQGRFLEMLTHEFKTSLAVLRMAIGTGKIGAKETLYAEQAIEGMNDVIERCAQAQALADQQITINNTEFHLKGLLSELVQRSRENDRIILICDVDVMVKTDLTLLKIIFSNLIDNAVKYSVAHTLISVTASMVGDKISVRIANQVHKGRMPDAALIFTKYYRASSSHRHMGSGLGLYLTYQLASMLGMQLNYTPVLELVEFELCLTPSA